MIAREVVPELNSDCSHPLGAYWPASMFVELCSQGRLRNRVRIPLIIKWEKQKTESRDMSWQCLHVPAALSSSCSIKLARTLRLA